VIAVQSPLERHAQRGTLRLTLSVALATALLLGEMLMVVALAGRVRGNGVAVQEWCFPSLYTYAVVNTYPHDAGAFTQGLVFEEGSLYESTGLYGRSTLRQVALETGEVLRSRNLPARFFGEGIAVYRGKIVQLTWRSHVGFVYDRDSFELLQEFSYPTEGWGVTYDGERLIVSDGTSSLYFWDPETFVETGRVEVRDRDGPVTRLNELEYIRGEVFANVWQTDRVARIDPQTGRVVAWVDLQGLLSPEMGWPADVLNGIAYDAVGDRLFVTGKLWPRLFEIDLAALGE